MSSVELVVAPQVNDATAQHAARESVPPKRALQQAADGKPVKQARVAWPDPKVTINKIEPMIKYAQRLSKQGKRIPDPLYAALQAWIDIEAVQSEAVGAERIVEAVLEILQGPTEEPAPVPKEPPSPIPEKPPPPIPIVPLTNTDSAASTNTDNATTNTGGAAITNTNTTHAGGTSWCAASGGGNHPGGRSIVPSAQGNGGACTGDTSDDSSDLEKDSYHGSNGTVGSGTGEDPPSGADSAFEQDDESLASDDDGEYDSDEGASLASESEDEFADDIRRLDVSQDVNDVLLIFSGSNDRAKRLATAITGLHPHVRVHEVDWLNDKDGENVLRKSVQNQILRGLADGKWQRVFIATPCSSFSIAKYQKEDGSFDFSALRRSKQQPEGIEPIPPEWERYIGMHNALANFSFVVFGLCMSLKIGCMLENPALRSDEQSLAFWKEAAGCGQLWDMPKCKALEADGARRVLIAHCAFGSDLQKYTELLCCPILYPIASAALKDKICKCTSKHIHRAIGTDEQGESRATAAAAYPWEACLAFAQVLTTKVTAASSSRLHLGSSKPHAIDGSQDQFSRVDRWAPLGSMRCLEPELKEVLQLEQLPITNVPRKANPLPKPSAPSQLPGPFTTAQLIPAKTVERTLKFGKDVAKCLARAARGPKGWQAAKKIRPETIVFEEHECLNECGRGFTWERVNPHEPLTADSLWRAVRPSRYPEDPPHPKGTKDRINIEHYLELAKKHGFTDERCLSMIQHGFTSPSMPAATILAPPHIGALKEASAYAERNASDAKSNFATQPNEFPQYWPTYLDPCNIVVQNGKPRLTIDKTMWTSGRAHLKPYNELVNMDKVNEEFGKMRLPTMWQFCRGAAILMSALIDSDTVKLKEFKMDKKAFFRVHSKQRLHISLSGRATAAGYMHDLTTNFGESDAPFNTCSESDGFIHFCRCELLRLDSAYPTQVKSLNIFLERRRRQREQQGTRADGMQQFLWDVLFFIMCYVDDDGIETFDDPLYDTKGEPVIVLRTLKNGQQARHHQTRIELYSDACVGIGEYIGHTFPIDKREGPCFNMVLLGIVSALDVERRMLPATKAFNYLELLRRVKVGRVMPNKIIATKYKPANSLLHRLLHASSVEPLGRAHLFHFRQCMKNPKMIKSLDGEKSERCILLSKAASRELDWWDHRLSTNDQSLGLPLASRYSFPGASSPSCLVRYSDASREVTKPSSESGGGGWSVMGKTFYYIHVEWTKEEMLKHSINVLEAHARDLFGTIMIDKAKELGYHITHSIAYIDNSTAEMIAEHGRTSTATLHELNKQRILARIASDVFETNERVASVDNDVADLISRGAVQEALRIPQEEGLAIVRLEVPAALRAIPESDSA